MSLRSLILIPASVILVLFFSASMVLFERGLGLYSQRTVETAVQVRGSALAPFVGRILHEEWRDAVAFAEEIDPEAGEIAIQNAIAGFGDGEKV